MGGSGSTRWGGLSRRCTVEESLRVGIKQIDPRSIAGPRWQWNRMQGVNVKFGEAIGTRRTLVISLTERPDLGDQDVVVEAISMRFGGVRWWFLCPMCCRRRRYIYLPLVARARRWGCQRCHGLKHVSQRLEPGDRIAKHMRRIAATVWGVWWDGWHDFPKQKPKRMHWATFSRKYATWQSLEDEREYHLNQNFFNATARLFKTHGRQGP